eukprot:gene24941-biopygen5976
MAQSTTSGTSQDRPSPPRAAPPRTCPGADAHRLYRGGGQAQVPGRVLTQTTTFWDSGHLCLAPGPGPDDGVVWSCAPQALPGLRTANAPRSVLFWSVLFCSVLFCSVLLYSVLPCPTQPTQHKPTPQHHHATTLQPSGDQQCKTAPKAPGEWEITAPSAPGIGKPAPKASGFVGPKTRDFANSTPCPGSARPRPRLLLFGGCLAPGPAAPAHHERHLPGQAQPTTSGDLGCSGSGGQAPKVPPCATPLEPDRRLRRPGGARGGNPCSSDALQMTWGSNRTCKVLKPQGLASPWPTF